MANIPDSPITRKEKYLDAIANGTTEVPEPITREEEYLAWIALNGGGGGGGTGEVTGVKGSAESTFRKGNVSISAANIGLDKVNNTSDLNKPVSNPQQAALDLKVDKVEGKVLSDNNYSDDDKAIVDGVETELAKKVNKVAGKGLSTNDYTNDDKAIVDGVTDALSGKVDKVSGKTLSTNDYTNADKEIVDGVADALAGKVDKVTGKGLSANDYTNTDKAIVDGVTAALAEKADKTDVIDGASYDSANHLILFKRGTDTLFSLDAAAFVKDGMVDTVSITGGNLVITFNTDAGKQAISIPLTDIFDPSNYYNKTATDNLLADKTDKVSGATNGNFAGLDASGNLTDSGKKAGDFQSIAYVYEGSKDTEQDIKDMLDAHLDAMENLTQDVFSFNDAARVIGGGTWVCVLYRVSASYASANFYGYYPYTKETICTCAKFDGRWQPIKKLLRTADLTSSVISESEKPITSGGVYTALQGKAEQEEVNGIVNALGAKNILNPSWLYNNSALTITPAYDVYGNLKKYTLDGTVTGNQVSILFARRAAKTLTLEAGTSWIFSIGNTLPSGGSMQVGYTHPTTGEWTLLKSQRADKLAFTVPDEAEGMYWTIQIVINDLTFDGYDIFPMLRPSFIEDDTYAPFAKTNGDLTREIEAMPHKVFTTPNTLLSTTNDANDFQCGFTRCSNANANLPTTGSGSSVLWYDVLTIRQANDPSSELWGYGFQLAIQTTTTETQSDTYVRAVNGGATPVWGAWKKLTA